MEIKTAKTALQKFSHNIGDDYGKMINNEVEICKRWKEYFEKL